MSTRRRTTARRQLATSLALFLGVVLTTSAPAGGSSTTEVIAVLNGVDFLPGPTQLTAIMGPDLAPLANIANGDGDPGVRRRAYRALGQFDTLAARGGLKAGIDRYRSAPGGTELLYLIAAAEGLSAIAGPGDVATLGPLLDAPSRDLRVVIARGLGRVANAEACTLLSRRAGPDVEQEDQVSVALIEALARCP